MDLTGIEIYKDGGFIRSCFTSGTLASGQTKDITGCTLDDDDGIYMSDANPSNSDVVGDETYVFIIDAVVGTMMALKLIVYVNLEKKW